jgi:hypothetical protein
MYIGLSSAHERYTGYGVGRFTGFKDIRESYTGYGVGRNTGYKDVRERDIRGGDRTRAPVARYG